MFFHQCSSNSDRSSDTTASPSAPESRLLKTQADYSATEKIAKNLEKHEDTEIRDHHREEKPGPDIFIPCFYSDPLQWGDGE